MLKPNHSNNKLALLIVFVVVCVDLLGFGMVVPLLPVYAKKLAGNYPDVQQAAILGTLLSCSTVVKFLCAPLWGRVSDRIGRRPVLLMGLCASCGSYAVLGVATLWGNLPGMLISRIGSGIAGGAITSARAYIADVTPRTRRTSGMALMGAAFGVGFTIGPLIGTIALLTSNDKGLSPWPGYTAAVLSGGALLFAMLMLPESLHANSTRHNRSTFDLSPLRRALAIPSVGLLLVAVFAGVFAMVNFETPLPLAVAKMLGAQVTSYRTLDVPTQVYILRLFAFIGLVQVIVQGGLVRWLSNFTSEAVLATAGAIVAIAGFLLLAAANLSVWQSLGLLMFGAAVVVTGLGLLVPSIQSLVSRRSDPADQGGVFGTAESIGALARIAGVYSAFFLYDQRHALPFAAAAAVMVFTLLLVTVAVRRGQDWENGCEA